MAEIAACNYICLYDGHVVLLLLLFFMHTLIVGSMLKGKYASTCAD